LKWMTRAHSRKCKHRSIRAASVGVGRCVWWWVPHVPAVMNPVARAKNRWAFALELVYVCKYLAGMSTTQVHDITAQRVVGLDELNTT
jgi:hypothetical protein